MDYCRWHDPTPEGRVRHRTESRRGGKNKAYGALATAPAIADVLDVDALDLETPAGCLTLLGGVLRQLSHLPFDVRVANATAQVATAQRAMIEQARMMRWIQGP